MNTRNSFAWSRLLITSALGLSLLLAVLGLLSDTQIPTAQAGPPLRLLFASPLPVGTDPTSNALNVPVTSDVSITFDEPISLTSVTSRTFAIFGSQSPISGLYSLSNLSRTVTLDPDRAFFPGERVDASVTTGTLSITGEHALSSTVWQFWAVVDGGSGALAAHPISPTFGASNSTDVALGDLDGDGDLDTVVANYNQAQTVWLNDGTGGLAPHPISPTFGTGNSYAVVLGDLDRDGDLDALVVNSGQAQTVWLNNGSGKFAPHPTTPGFGGGSSRAAALGDVDGDGDLDAVIANDGQAQTVWLNDGAGSFTAHPVTPSFGSGNTYDVALGDLDNDGDLDTLVSNDSLSNTVWLNDGRGNFTAHPTTPGFDADSGDHGCALGDIDEDGDLDAVVARWGRTQRVWLNDGAGNLTAHPTTPNFGGGDSWAVTLGDLDGDGDLDAIVVNLNNQTSTVWLNNGTGGFTAHPVTPNFGADESYYAAMGDVDGDGDLDAFVANNGQANTVWLNRNRADLRITKAVAPAVAAPGDSITYTLVYTNDGPGIAVGVVITDVVPVGQIANLSYARSGAAITATGSVSYTWQVEDLAPGDGGVITITGIVSPSVTGTFSLTNRVTITATAVDANTQNNTSVVSNTVDAEPPDPPTLTSPTDGAVVGDSTPTLAWQDSPSSDVAGYLLDLNGVIADVGAVTQYTTTLLAEATYTWTVAAYDGLGNTSSYTDVWSFTIDTDPPKVDAVAPVNGATDVDVAALVVITFSEPINTSTFAYSVTPNPGGWAETWSGGGTVVTLDHTAFSGGAVCTVTVTTADDLAGNQLSGAPYDWHFTTVDATSPQVLAVNPANGAMGVEVTAPVVITFSEPISTSTFAYSVTPDPGGWAEAWSGGGTVVTLDHTAFGEETAYTVTVTAAGDLAGNPLSGAPVEWYFTTAPRLIYLPLVLKRYFTTAPRLIYLPLVLRNF